MNIGKEMRERTRPVQPVLGPFPFPLQSRARILNERPNAAVISGQVAVDPSFQIAFLLKTAVRRCATSSQ